MALLRERCLIWAAVDLLRRIRGGSFNLGRQLHSNSWFIMILGEDPWFKEGNPQLTLKIPQEVKPL
jgi:hypothetical protein